MPTVSSMHELLKKIGRDQPARHPRSLPAQAPRRTPSTRGSSAKKPGSRRARLCKSEIGIRNVRQLYGGFAALVRTDAHHFVERKHEDFAVADLSGFGGLRDRIDCL